MPNEDEASGYAHPSSTLRVKGLLHAERRRGIGLRSPFVYAQGEGVSSCRAKTRHRATLTLRLRSGRKSFFMPSEDEASGYGSPFVSAQGEGASSCRMKTRHRTPPILRLRSG